MKTKKLIPSATVLIAVAFIATGCSSSEDSTSSSSPGATLDGYLKVSQALFHDNLADAKAAAADVASDSPLAEHARAVAHAETLQEARKEFIPLSQEAVRLSKDRPGFHVMSCPMVDGGLWVQTNTSVKNPYMGQKMPNCGGPHR